MTSENPTTSMQERMADLKETLKKEKVKLTPELEQYIQEHVRAVQDKLQAGEPVYEEDLAFIDEVKLWVGMPEEWRERYVSIGEVQNSAEQAEAKERRLELVQWLLFLNMMKLAGKDRKWISENCEFPGNGQIKVEGLFSLRDQTDLKSLPQGLKVKWDLSLSGCTGLTSLPADLEVGGTLSLAGCKNLKSLSEGLSVGNSLFLTDCLALESLTKELRVGDSMNTDRDIYDRFEEDIDRLIREGKIRRWRHVRD